MNIYPYDGERVRVVCKDGRVYEGVAERVSPACGIDANDDILVIGKTEILASEIAEITLTENIIDKLRRGEKVLCCKCKNHYYDVSFPNRQYSNYFHCEDPDCDGYVHIQKTLDIE